MTPASATPQADPAGDTIPGNMPGASNVPDPSQIAHLIDDAVARLLSSLMEKEVGPVLSELSRSLQARTDQRIIEAEARIAAQIPTIDQLTALGDRQAQTQKEQVMALLRDRANGNGHYPPNGDANSPPLSNAGGANDPPGTRTPALALGGDGKGKGPTLMEIIAALGAVLDKGFDKWMSWQGLKLAQTNPLAMAKYMAATDPTSAKFIGLMLSADPMQAQIPGMVANTADVTSRALLTGLARAGLINPGLVPQQPVVPPTPQAPAPPLAPAAPAAPAPGPSAASNPSSSPAASPNPSGSTSGGSSEGAPRPPVSNSAAKMQNQGRRELRFSDLI